MNINTLTKCIVIIFFALQTFEHQTLADDSIPTIELKEVEIIGERGWIDADGTMNFIPNRKEKRLSNSPGSLIKLMNLPILRASGDDIIHVSGESVDIYINGVKGNDIDMSTFWPMEVKSVQYMENPSDSRFAGSTYVVNFITHQYKAGGVSSTDVSQHCPNNGFYRTAAKLVYKNMTFGAMLHGAYIRDHNASTSGTTIYRDIYYDGVFHDEITRSEESRQISRTDIMNYSLNARYINKNFIATHSLSLGWISDPGSSSVSSDIWTDNIFGSIMSKSWTSSRSLTPQFSGNYHINISDKWHLPFSVAYIFTDNKASSGNRFGDTEEILNNTCEKINTIDLKVYPWLNISDRMYVQMNLISRWQWFSTQYEGSVETLQKQKRVSSTAGVTFGWRPVRSMGLTITPGLALTQWSIGDIHEHTLLPTLNARIGWSPSTKYSLSGSLMLGVKPPTACESNPVVVKNSELMWSSGNPYLKGRTDWDVYLFNTYLLGKGLSFGLGTGYTRIDREIVPEYEIMSPETGGLLLKNINAGATDAVRVILSANWTIPSSGLSFSVTPRWDFNRNRDRHNRSFSKLSIDGNASYTFRSFRIDVDYTGPYSTLDMAGMQESWSQEKYSIGVTYGNGNLLVGVKVENVFHSKTKGWSRFTSPLFNTEQTSFATGRCAVINLSYTFGFGKRVDHSIDISGPETVESSVN